MKNEVRDSRIRGGILHLAGLGESEKTALKALRRLATFGTEVTNERSKARLIGQGLIHEDGTLPEGARDIILEMIPES